MQENNSNSDKTIVCSVCDSIVSLNEIDVIDGDANTIQFRCNKCNRYSNSVVSYRRRRSNTRSFRNGNPKRR